MNTISKAANVAGLLYGVIEILGLLRSYVPVDPSRTAMVWLAANAVLEGFVSRIEIMGGLWVLLVTWGALLAGRLPRLLNYLGVVIGVAGILTVVPAFKVLGIGFELGEIVWIIWLGIVVLRGHLSATAQPPAFVPRHARDWNPAAQSSIGEGSSASAQYSNLDK